MTITLTPETETLLRRRAERDGQDPNALADVLLADILTTDPDALTDAEITQIRISIRQGLADCDAGRAKPASGWADQLRREFDLPPHLSDSDLRQCVCPQTKQTAIRPYTQSSFPISPMPRRGEPTNGS